MELNLLKLLILFSLVQGIIFFLATSFSKLFSGRKSLYLGSTIFITSIIGLNEYLSEAGFDDQYYVIDVVGDDVPWMLLVYVPLYFFFSVATNPAYKLTNSSFWLCSPFIVFLLLNIHINLDVDFHWYEIPHIDRYQSFVYLLEECTAILLSLSLCIASFKHLKKADLPKKENTWLLHIWTFSAMLLFLWAIVFISPTTDFVLDSCLWVGVSVFIYWLTVKGLYQFRLLNHPQLILQLSGESLNMRSPKKSATPAFSPTEEAFNPKTNMHMEKLTQLLEKDKIYKDPQLSRDLVAEKLGISSGYVSQIVNSASGRNFSQFINAYRVDEVKKLLCDPAYDDYSFLAIGKEAGFTSKSAFYTTFKKEVGMTPRAFKEFENCSKH